MRGRRCHHSGRTGRRGVLVHRLCLRPSELVSLLLLLLLTIRFGSVWLAARRLGFRKAFQSLKLRRLNIANEVSVTIERHWLSEMLSVVLLMKRETARWFGDGAAKWVADAVGCGK